MTKNIALLLGLLAGLVAVDKAAMGEDAVLRTAAKPVKRSEPIYPQAELRRNRQGWVKLNYVITEEGQVIEPVIVESSGSPAFERAALRSVIRWKYEPAMENGEAVQQCKNKVMIAFAIDGKSQLVSKSFNTRYKRMRKDVTSGKLDQASVAIDKAMDRDDLTLSENAWLWALKAEIARAKGDKANQLVALRRALGSSDEWIPEDLRKGLLMAKVVLEIEGGDYSSAMTTFDRLAALESADTSALDPIIEQINALIDSDQLFYRAGMIGGNANCETCDSQWQYSPLRRSVELAEVEGELETVEFRCDWQRYTADAREGVAWQLPDSWGDCSVVVSGTPGSSFKLFEIPNQ